MCMSKSKKKDIPHQQPLFLLLMVCLAAAVEAGAGVDLPYVAPTLNVDKSNLDFDHLVEAKLNDSSREEVRSRQRRYLVFPEGSSFQVGE